jgi:Protein of unknown function VcgC/VcgE (DUF2780)
MNNRFFIKIIILMAIGIFSITSPVSADTSKLIGSLVDQLGVSKEQATGGSGAVFKEAKNNMSPGDYSQLLNAVPGIDSLISSAPKTGGLTGKASSLLSGSSGSAGGMAALADSFGKLGLSPDMVNQFVPVILDFVQSEGGKQAMGLLKNALF